ncbi:Aurora kinase 2 splicing [Colletotrichum higginsianum IMI 349063]|uniref:Aurora kinase 2 splicing n=1 Tax=Colletotrichum higginsianum (strain IMI 349063) TaxID=759273 RepID=A0A1B7XQX6_COLHI|nr:Aurora kinase 2 splicing [Colletotrichum higginsianum IMI 349063]OBR02159.1 Aurora kinase 2 splicing [Colletotrichum higginsianum IMI 349063]
MAEASTTPPLPPSQASVGHIIPIPIKISGDVDHDTWGKWSSFDPTRADNTPSQAASVIAFLVEYYARQSLTGRDLWSEFQSDFEAWPEEAFIKTPSSIMRILRNHLRANGVYVRMDGSRIVKNVIDVISQERFHVWTQAEIDEVADKHRSFKTLLNDKTFADDIRGGQPIVTSQPNPSRDHDEPPSPINLSTSPLLHHRRHDPALDDQMPPSKQLTDLTKLYTNEMKYGGGMYDVFDSKMLIFRDNCHKAGITQRHFAGAFSIMLRDKALAFYFDRLCDDQAPADFHAMASRVKLHFETEESRQAYLTEWRNTTFDRVAIDNPGKSKMEVLEVMLDKLITIQRALPTAYNTEDSLRLQVLNACRGVKACEMALFSPAPTYEGVCGQLRSAIGTSMAIDASPHHFTSDMPPADRAAEGQYLTDRKFNGNGRDARFGRPRSSFHGGKMGNRGSLPTATKKCYVCKKQGCWSTKHTAEERRKAYADFKSNTNVRDTSIPAYNHFLALHEGIEDFDAPDEPLAQYLQPTEANVSDDDEGESFFTSFFNTTSDGSLITAALADRSTFHALTKDDYRQQRKGSNTFTLEGRYGPSTFHGIMPDSGAAGFSTAGHPQYLALQRALPTVTMTTPPTEAVVRFGSGDPHTSMGIVTVPTPIGDIPFHVVSSNTPFFFCLEDMDRLGPLYDIAEGGTHWWAAYHGHHKENLQMETSSFDPCLLVSSDESNDFGIVGMQTDDTLGLSDEAFSRKEEEQLKKAAFTAKAKEVLTMSDPLTFNGGTLSLTGGNTLTLRQKGQGNKLALVPIDGPDAKQKYVEQRARGAYIASICQPEACFDLSSAAQHQDPSIDDYKNLNRRLKWQMDHLDRGLTFMPVNLPTAKLFVFVDGSFANNVDLTSQLGFIIVLANEKQADEDTFTITGNIVHFSSTKSKRVTRSLLASEVYGMVAGIDMAYAISTTLRMITDRLSLPPIPTIVCTDSYSLYECLVKLGTTKEKRLMIDIMALRQSYERRELHEVRWINGSDNPADAFTKASPNMALEGLIINNEINVRMEGWVTRR